MKAQLALLGIEADIDPVSSKGEQWLRVRVGPFTSKREMNKGRNRIHSNNINTMLVQIKK
jgi:cell division protein FtsN